MGLSKPKPHTKFEVASFSRCRNIQGKPKISGSSLAHDHAHFLFCVGYCDRAWQRPPACQFWSRYLQLLQNIKGDEPQILRSFPSPWPRPLFWCDFIVALGKPKLHTKFEVAIFSRFYINFYLTANSIFTAPSNSPKMIFWCRASPMVESDRLLISYWSAIIISIHSFSKCATFYDISTTI